MPQPPIASSSAAFCSYTPGHLRRRRRRWASAASHRAGASSVGQDGAGGLGAVGVEARLDQPGAERRDREVVGADRMDVAAQMAHVAAAERQRVEEQRESPAAASRTRELAFSVLGVVTTTMRARLGDAGQLAQEGELVLDVLDDLDADDGVEARRRRRAAGRPLPIGAQSHRRVAKLLRHDVARGDALAGIETARRASASPSALREEAVAGADVDDARPSPSRGRRAARALAGGDGVGQRTDVGHRTAVRLFGC